MTFTTGEYIVYINQPKVSTGYTGIPGQFNLHQNYPNPFNPETTIKYQLPESRYVTITIFNSMAQEVATLVNEVKEAGYHSVNWNAGDAAAGLYFCTIKAGEFTKTTKMTLLK